MNFTCLLSLQATFGVKYKNVAPVRAPRGPAGSENRSHTMRQLSSSMSSLDQVGRPEPRLAKMIAPREDERATFDTYTYKWCMPSYYGKGKIQTDNLCSNQPKNDISDHKITQ